MKALFKQSRTSLSRRERVKKLREKGLQIGRYRVRKLMKKLGLIVGQRIAYKGTTKRKANDSVAENLLNQNFHPVGPNQILAGMWELASLENYRPTSEACECLKMCPDLVNQNTRFRPLKLALIGYRYERVSR